MELLAGSVKKRFLHWVRDAQRLPVDMSAMQYYEELVRQVLAPRLLHEHENERKRSETSGRVEGDSDDESIPARSRMQVLAASASKPLDEAGLRVYVAQNMLEELRGPGVQALKVYHRTLEDFLGLLDLPHPLVRRGNRVQPMDTLPPVPKAALMDAGGEGEATSGVGGSGLAPNADGAMSSAAIAATFATLIDCTGDGRANPCFVMSVDLRGGLTEYLIEQVQMTEESAAACVLKVDRAMQHVLHSEGEELLLDGEETVVSAEQLGSLVMHFYEPLALHLAEEHLGWVAQHLRRYASNRGATGRVLDDLFRESFCGWMVRQRHVQDARTAAVLVEELEALLRPFLGRTERHISVERAKEVMRKNLALAMAHAPVAAPPPAVEDHMLSPVERHFQVFLGLAPSSSAPLPTAPRVKRRPMPTQEPNRSTVITTELRNEFLGFLTQSRRLADATATAVVADLDRMMEWCLRRIPMPPPPSPPQEPLAGPSSATGPLPLLPPPLPPLHLPALPLDREAAKRVLQAQPTLGVEYVASRRREGRQSSLLPHLQAFLQLPVTHIKGPKRARVDSIISPQLRQEFMKWLQEEKRLSAKCSKNYLGEISAMFKHLLVLPEEDVHQLLLDKEHVKDMIVKHGPQLEQVMDERKKAGKLRDAAVTWLNVFLGIKSDARASVSRRPLISMKEAFSGAGPSAVPGVPEEAQQPMAGVARGGQDHGQEAEQAAQGDQGHQDMGRDDGQALPPHKRSREEGEMGVSDHPSMRVASSTPL